MFLTERNINYHGVQLGWCCSHWQLYLSSHFRYAINFLKKHIVILSKVWCTINEIIILTMRSFHLLIQTILIAKYWKKIWHTRVNLLKICWPEWPLGLFYVFISLFYFNLLVFTLFHIYWYWHTVLQFHKFECKKVHWCKQLTKLSLNTKCHVCTLSINQIIQTSSVD